MSEAVTSISALRKKERLTLEQTLYGCQNNILENSRWTDVCLAGPSFRAAIFCLREDQASDANRVLDMQSFLTGCAALGIIV